MEGGQKVKIPLDSGLDVKSSDMLVSVQEPKFQHNRQKFQGRYLPSSVRFEHDGWAAGNDVYQFKVDDYFIEAGSFHVSRYKVNNYPVYKITFNKDDTEVGSVVYSSNSRFIESNTDTKAVTSGANPTITGTINGKSFTLDYNSITNELTRSDSTHTDIILKTFDFAEDYAANISLQDTAATIDMHFPGITLASPEIRNGEYIIGTFELSTENVSTWYSGKYTIVIDRDGQTAADQFMVKDAKGNKLDLPDLQFTETEDGLVDVSFTAPITFIDTPQVMLQEFFPFFSEVSVPSNNMLVYMQANRNLKFNTWTVTSEDRDHRGINNNNKLYRNFMLGYTDFNKVTVEQTIPCWFGVSATGGYTQDTTGLEVVVPAGETLDSIVERDVAVTGSGGSHPNDATVTISIKTTDEVVKYSDVCYKPNISIWEGTANKTADYPIGPTNVTVTVKYQFDRWTNPYGSDWVLDRHQKTQTFTLTTEYSNLNTENIRNMVTFSKSRDDAYAELLEISVSDGGGLNLTFTPDLTNCPFYKSGNLTFRCTPTTTEITSVPVLKGVVNTLGEKAAYAQKLKTNADGNMGNNSVLTDLAFWGRCVEAKTASNVFISKDEILTSNLNASYFDIEQVEPSDTVNYVNVNSLFKHSIVQAIGQATLNISVYLVSNEIAQTVFYSTAMPLTSDESDTYFMPGHIVFGSISRVNSDLFNMSTYKVAKKYTAQSLDYNYGFNFTLSATPVSTANDSDSLFSYVLGIESAVDTENLLKGNKFSEEDIYTFIQKVNFNAKLPEYWIDITEDVGNDLLYIKDATQKVQLLIDEDVKATFTYDLKGSILSGAGSFDFEDYNITYEPKALEETSSNLQPIQEMYIEYKTTSEYVSQFYNTKMLSTDFTLVSYSNNNAVVTTMYNGLPTTLYINFTTKQVVVRQNNIDRDTEETWGDNNSISIFAEDIRTISMILFGIYTPENIEVTSLTPTTLQGTIDDEEVSIDLVALLDPSKFSKVDFLYTKVDEAELEERKFAEAVSEDEFQFLKQQWDTTNATENFWWLNGSNILALTKDVFSIRHKTQDLDDWNGDTFTVSKEYNRTDILNTNVLKYFCTSAYNNQTARFITVSGGNVITINVYNPLNNMIKNTFTVGIVKREINKAGMLLCPDSNNMYTYSDLIIDNVISQSKWTATCIDNYCIIGIHFDNNFNQWAIIINLTNNTIDRIIQGYGFVGINGCLTGGEIPAKWFDVSKGFTGMVLSLDSLSDTSTAINTPVELQGRFSKIVGTDAQQWYIDTEVKEIVSHIIYKNGIFIAQRLPLNNNYSIRYASGSFAMQDNKDANKMQDKNLMDLVDNAIWKTICTTFLNPHIYYIDAKETIANYLQQTLGQAAYVHYNSTSIRQQRDLTKESIVNNYSKEEADAAYDKSKEEAAISSDELSFDVQTVKQTSDTPASNRTILSTLLVSLSSATQYAIEKLAVNQNQNQSAISDFGKKYTQFFLQNINSMAPSSMYLQSARPTQTSEVTAIKTLDMFYSTSDKQQICAGPGYVNHNFVAQCVSQSVTSVQAEFRQQRYIFLPSGLAMLTLESALKAVEASAASLEKTIDALGGGAFTSAAAAAAAAGYAVLKSANVFLEVGEDILPTILDALGADKMQSSITATLSRHNYDIEGKHKYGSKSESFMWPCFGIPVAQNILDESVEVVTQNKEWKASLDGVTVNILANSGDIKNVTNLNNLNNFNTIPYYIAMLKGKQSKVKLPEKMAYIIGTESFLPTTDFKNENISESEPVFATAPFQDYIIDENWQISQTASVGMTTWVSCKDTKIIDGEFSNCVINANFCGVASPYTAVEVRRGISKKYLRPWAITPQVIALNNTGLNTCFEEKAYHGFDGYGYRVTSWLGSAGMNKEKQTWMYSFLVNDRFKRSNKLPPNEFMGNFKCDPVVAITGDYSDKVFTLVTQPGENMGIQAGTIGEDKDVRRYSLPVFSEFVNTLPAAVKTVSAQVLSVVDGITSLTTENRDLQTAYKAPLSVDFTIGKNKYRFTQDYICSLTQEQGVTVVENLVPCLGLTFIGSTPYEAYLYSQATRQYYIFTGGSSLQMVDMIERFYDVINGRYDFVNQEVLLPCTATFLRLDKKVKDDEDITDNVIIPRLKDRQFIGEVYPPIDTIYNTNSWFRTLSLPCGITYQGPNRCIINRFVVQKYMINQIKDNYGLWKRVPREEYHPFRVYKDKYEQVDKYIGDSVEVKGWTHNPFLLVTSPLGVAEEVDCNFEWEITFCWPVEMEELYGNNNYATVNIQAETITPGGKVIADRPVHVFLVKELFTRTNNFGYYSFRYQSKCGAGNRERLHIWSDQYICVSSLQLEYKQISEKRTGILTQQVDIKDMKEI